MPNFHIVLIEPEIPGNTGAAARIACATNSSLHLVGRLGFQLDDKRLKRAGLDYWQHTKIFRHNTLEDCKRETGIELCYYLSTRAKQSLFEEEIQSPSLLVFGCETKGLPDSYLADPSVCIKIPMFSTHIRSLNLSTSIAIVTYEAIRQNSIEPLST